MIKFLDALKLAYTKLRTRKLRLFITVFIASLLFSGLVFGTLVVTGALKSFDSFSKEGLSGRYIVSGVNMLMNESFNMLNKPEIIAKVEARWAVRVAEQKAYAKKLGIEIPDAATGPQNPIFKDEQGIKHLNQMAPTVREVLAEYETTNPDKIDLERFKKQINLPSAQYFEGRSKALFAEGPRLAVIENGKEQSDANSKSSPAQFMGPGSSGLKSMVDEWNLLDEGLLRDFLLPGQSLKVGTDGSMPIIASYSAAQQVLKLPTLSKTANSEQKLERLKAVRQRVAGTTFQVCYRNQTSLANVQRAVQQQAELEANKTNKDYVKPSLIYKPSTVPCTEPLVERDVRTADEKKLQQKMDEFDQAFGAPLPVSTTLTFRIVGITPDSPFSGGAGDSEITAQGILTAILSSSIGTRWVSPVSVMEHNPQAKEYFRYVPDGLGSMQRMFFAEVSNAETARNILKTRTCRPLYEGLGAKDSAATNCELKTRAFMLGSFGSVNLALDEFRSSFRTVQLWAAAIVGGIATLILMGMIGRIIADARRETAVFRATGATRLMIAQIYLTYTIYLVGLIVLMSLAVGFGLALWVDGWLGPDASVSMALMFNISDLTKQVHFYGLEFYDMGLIVLTVLVAAVVSSLIPIAHNIRRNPISDMREE